MKKKIVLIAAPIVLLLGGGAAYALAVAHQPKAKPSRIDGVLVPLVDPFVVNLAGGHYGKVSVALLMRSAPPGLPNGAPPKLPQNAAVRAAITDELTGIAPRELIERDERHQLVARLEQVLRRQTDEPIKRVLLTDIAVQ